MSSMFSCLGSGYHQLHPFSRDAENVNPSAPIRALWEGEFPGRCQLVYSDYNAGKHAFMIEAIRDSGNIGATSQHL